MAWTEILTTVAAGRRQLDRQTASFYDLATRQQARIYCEKGCCNCCTLAVNCSFPEALAISRSLTASQKQDLADKLPQLRKISLQAKDLKDFLQLFREQLGGCPFLNHQEGNCGIYPLRPFSCRALLSTRNSSWCAIDFSSLHPLEREAFLSSLDPQLVAFPTHYLGASQELGLELESLTITAMRETFAVALSGNLIYQIWLELEHQLSGVITGGFEATRAFLEERELDLPFLLQMQGS